jgi:hypothetical protein
VSRGGWSVRFENPMGVRERKLRRRFSSRESWAMEGTTKTGIGSRSRPGWAGFSTAFYALCPSAIRLPADHRPPITSC